MNPISTDSVALRFYYFPNSMRVEVWNPNLIGVRRVHKPRQTDNSVFAKFLKLYPNARIITGENNVWVLSEWMQRNNIPAVSLAA